MRAFLRSTCLLSTCLIAACGSSNDPAPVAADTGVTEETAVPSGPLALENGEVADVPGDGTFRVRLATTGTEGFVIVLGSTRFDRTTGTFPYAIAQAPIEGETTATLAKGCAIDSAAWQTAPAKETPPSGAAPAVGTKRTLQIGGTAIDAEVMAVGTSAVVWRDVSPTSTANLDAAFVAGFLDDFEKVIVPRERAIFGDESDQDGDGHIGLVFSPLTYSDMAIAYFSGCDLQTLSGCPEGNKGEFIYLTPPDVIAPPYNTPAAMKEILAHETAHLVEFNRKVLRNGLTGGNPDSAYMAEGIGALAQDVIGFQAGNLYVTQAGLQQLDSFSLANVLKDRAAYDSKLDGTMRGGAYLFARFLYDRAGGDTVGSDGTIATKGGPAFLRALLDDKTSVTSALATVGKANVADVAMDFFTALAMSNREHQKGVAPKNGCFAYLPQVNDPTTGKPRGTDLFGMFHGMPMGGPKLQKASAPSGTIKPGGVELLTVDATGAGELDLTITVDAGAAARVRIGRIR